MKHEIVLTSSCVSICPEADTEAVEKEESPQSISLPCSVAPTAVTPKANQRKSGRGRPPSKKTVDTAMAAPSRTMFKVVDVDYGEDLASSTDDVLKVC